MTRQSYQSIRNAHIQSALGLRRTAQEWSMMAREFPENAVKYLAEAKRVRDYARWDISMARNVDTWNAWMEAQ